MVTYHKTSHAHIGVEYKTPLKRIKPKFQIGCSCYSQNRPQSFDAVTSPFCQDSSLEFRIRILCSDADIVLYLDLQQDINHGLMREFQDKNISLPIPVQTLYLDQPKRSKKQVRGSPSTDKSSVFHWPTPT